MQVLFSLDLRCAKLPEVEFFIQTANVPSMTLGEATMANTTKRYTNSR